MLKIDEKYFVPFISVIAVILTAAIFVYSFEYSDTQQENFLNEVDSFSWDEARFMEISDTTQPIHLSNTYHILFFAEWSPRSIEAAQTLRTNVPDSLILFALVKDSLQFVQKVWADVPETRVTLGTELYANLKTPGLPSLIIVKDQKVDTAIVGYRTPESYSFLNSY